MSGESRVRPLLLFLLKFSVLAPICLYVWWWKLLPPYAWLVGQTSAGVINLFASEPITAMRIIVNPEGVLTSDTALLYVVGAIERVMPVSDLLNSSVPYIVLVLATGALTWKRRLGILILGTVIFFVGQIVFLTSFFLLAKELQESHEIGKAIAQFWMTLPFVLWIVLAHWDKFRMYFSEDDEASDSTSETK